MKTKKNPDAIAVNFPVVARPYLCYVSESKGFGFCQIMLLYLKKKSYNYKMSTHCKMSYSCKMSTHCKISYNCKMPTRCKMSTHCRAYDKADRLVRMG